MKMPSVYHGGLEWTLWEIRRGARTFLRGQQSLVGPSLLWKPLTGALLSNDAEAAKVLVQDAVEKTGHEQSKR